MSLLLTARSRAPAGDSYLMARQHILWPAFAASAPASAVYYGDSSSIFGGYFYTSSNSQNASWTWDNVVLSEGDYIIKVLCYKNFSNGILHVSFGGIDTGARLDLYAASLTYNQIVSDTFTVSAATRGTLSLAISSTSAPTYYYGDILQVAIIKTSAGGDEGADSDDLPWIVGVPIMSYSSQSSGWARETYNGYVGGTNLYSDNANGRWVEYQVWIPAGTWSFDLLSYRFSSQGIVDISLDGSEVGSIDLYSGSSQLNYKSTATGIVVPETKIYTLRMTVDGKNASSSNYGFQYVGMQFRRTA